MYPYQEVPMMKRGQGISMNVIIIAAIALLVLVVLSVIFLSRSGLFARETVNCRQNGGVCVDNDEACPGTHPISYFSWKCLKADNSVDTELKCCIEGGR
jgi:hypothetical protein